VKPIRRRTTCRVPGHGTRCEVAHEKPSRFERCTEERLALEFEEAAERTDSPPSV
jgi:hypothetical protein